MVHEKNLIRSKLVKTDQNDVFIQFWKVFDPKQIFVECRGPEKTGMHEGRNLISDSKKKIGNRVTMFVQSNLYSI